MRRTNLLAPLFSVLLTLPGCVGFDDYFDNTHSLGSNPNIPMGDGLNMRRVQGQTAAITPIAPEPGNVWPRSVEPLPSLQNIEPDRGGAPRGATSQRPAQTGALPTSLAPMSMTPPSLTPSAAPPAPLAAAPTLPQTVIPTASGPAIVTTGTERYQTVNTPTGTAVVVPNGNGTATLMRADGTMEVVTVPR